MQEEPELHRAAVGQHAAVQGGAAAARLRHRPVRDADHAGDDGRPGDRDTLQPAADRGGRLRPPVVFPTVAHRPGPDPHDRDRRPRRRAARPRARGVRRRSVASWGSSRVSLPTAGTDGPRPRRATCRSMRHLHTDLSPDSDVPIDAYAAQAVERRSPRSPSRTTSTSIRARRTLHHVRRRERTVRDAAERWAHAASPSGSGSRSLRPPLGRRHPPTTSPPRLRLRDRLASTSTATRSTPPRVAAWVAGRSLARSSPRTSTRSRPAIQSGLFDAFGHLDFVKRYLVPYVTPADLAAAPELYEPLLRALVESGTALEVNTSGLRQAPDETYPRRRSSLVIGLGGGGAVTVGSDAHGADAFASGLDAGRRGRRGRAARLSRRRDGTRSPPAGRRARGVPLGRT